MQTFVPIKINELTVYLCIRSDTDPDPVLDRAFQTYK
jgi:hypothetical protein